MANGAIRLTWRDRNWAEQGHYIYRSDTPMDVNNLPNPIDTVDGNVTEYIDYEVIVDQIYYYRIGAYRNNDVMISDEIEVVANPSTIDTHDVFGDGSAIATYQFNGNVNDLGGNFNGNVVGSTIFIEGNIDNGFSFDGYTHVESTFNVVDQTTPFAVSMWIYNGLQNYKSGNGLWGIGTPTSTKQISAYQATGNGYIGFDYWGTTTYTSNIAVLSNTWDHVVWIYDASNITNWVNSISIYVNGNRINLIVERDGGMALNIEPNKLYIGGIGDSSYNSTVDMDQVRIFNRSLTPEEVNALYEEGLN